MNPRAPEKWLGIGRKGWERIQWIIGIWNGVSLWDAIFDSRWLVAYVSLLAVLVTARWRLPYAPPRDTK